MPATSLTNAAATDLVTSGADSGAGTLRAVLGLAAAGDTVAFAASLAKVTLGSTLASATDLTIDGAAGRGAAPQVVIGGTGSLLLSGNDTLGHLTVTGTALLRNNGTVSQTSTLVLGGSGIGAARMTNAAGHLWSLVGDAGIAAGNTAATFNNGGGTLLKASGTGTSTIGVGFTNLSGLRGTITVASGTLLLQGTTSDLSNEAIGGAGAFVLGGGVATAGTGTTIAAASFAVQGGGTVLTLAADLSYTAGAFLLRDGSALDLGAQVMTLGNSTMLGSSGGTPTVRGAGKLVINGDGAIASTGAGSTGLVVGGSALLRANKSIAQTADLVVGDTTGGAARVTNGATSRWTLAAGNILAGNGAATFNNGGGTLVTGASSVTQTIATNFSNLSGLVGTIDIQAGTLLFTGGGVDLGHETIVGGGTLAIAASAAAIGPATTLATAGWTIGGDSTDVGLGADLSYAGAFAMNDASTLDLGSHTLRLTGPASFGTGSGGSPALMGSGTLVTTGSTTIGGLVIGGTTVFRNEGTVNQTGSMQVGDTSYQVSLLMTASNSTWAITDDSDIRQGATWATMFDDGGLLIKSGGSGTSTITACFQNTSNTVGIVEVASGTLDLAGTLQGALALKVDAGRTMILDEVASWNTTAAFAGPNATLVLNKAQAYYGAIAGFATSDKLDLGSIQFGTNGPAVQYSGNGASGTLTVSDGTTTAHLAMVGAYAQSNFHAAADGHGGTQFVFA